MLDVCRRCLIERQDLRKLSAGVPDWQVLRASGWRVGREYFSLAGQKIDEWMSVSVIVVDFMAALQCFSNFGKGKVR